MKPITHLRKAFPNCNIAELGSKPNAYGCNLYFDNICVTVYWTKKRYGVGEKWGYYKDMSDLVEIINTLVNPPPKAPHIAPQPPKTPIMDYVNDSQTGIELAMMHIQKKIDYGQANNLSPSNVAMLNNLLNELRQYL